MINQVSQPQIQPATIPDSFCPTGTIANIFNAYQDQYLAQAIIEGVSSADNATIIEIQAELVNLQNQITALTKYYRNGTQAVPTGDSSVVFGFAAVSSILYDVGIIPISATGAEVDPFSWGLVSGSQTTSSFTIRFVDIPSTISTVQWWVRQR